MNFRDYDALVRALDQADGVLTVEMGQLRDAHGAGKLGVNVVAGISEQLASRGLSHYPRTLPLNQWEPARVYRNGSPISRLIEAVLTANKDNDDVLRETAGNESTEVLRKIKELVCD